MIHFAAPLGIALVLGTIAVSIFLPLYSYLGTLM